MHVPNEDLGHRAPTGDGHHVGQLSGVGVDAQNRVYVFHRSGRVWSKPFPKEAIAAPTVSVFDGATGRLLSSWGANCKVVELRQRNPTSLS
jgi:hypothetical protein